MHDTSDCALGLVSLKLSLSCAWRLTSRDLHRWTTAVNVKLLLPPRQSRGNSFADATAAYIDAHISANKRRPSDQVAWPSESACLKRRATALKLYPDFPSYECFR